MQRCLDAAAEEIDWELGYTAEAPAPIPPPPLVEEVNIERAVEHWRQSFSPFGVIGVGAESEPIVTARDTWYRHARKLAPLKLTYGVAWPVCPPQIDGAARDQSGRSSRGDDACAAAGRDCRRAP